MHTTHNRKPNSAGKRLTRNSQLQRNNEFDYLNLLPGIKDKHIS